MARGPTSHHFNAMPKCSMGWLLAAVMAALPGCDDSDDRRDLATQDLSVPADLTAARDLLTGGDAGFGTRNATLTGAQEVPPVTTSATGTSVAVVNATRTEIAVTVNATGFTTAITAAHIHSGPPGVAGPILFDLSLGPFTSPLQKTLTAADLKQGQGTFVQAVDLLLSGGTYVNVHTTAYPNGEIRGQLQ
jgi:hypothetical protein